ncbi:MAG: hypothetical protein QF464_10930 [Myxococcota bacterium]|jgi:hypothetical protein|nr:hypothetical protein [Myxococcota bacterium]
MNARVLVVLAIVASLVAVVTMVRWEDPERKLVEATLRGIVEAIELGDEEMLASFIAVDYGDRLGQDHRAAVRRAVHEVEHIPEVFIELEDLDIDVDESTRRATATFRPALSGDVDSSLKKHPKFNFERGKRLIVRMRKQDGLYIVTRADIGYAFKAALQ